MRIARLQQFTTFLLLAIALGWAVGAVRAGSPGWAALGAVLIVFSYAVFLGIEFVMVAWVHGDDPTPRATKGQLLRAWWGEVWSAPRVFCWDQPFRAHRWPDHLPAAQPPGTRGVVLVHGFLCNRGFWNPWLPRLREQGIAHVAVSLEPEFGSIDRYVPQIDDAVRRVQAATGLPPVIVAHSMGGLAVRAWLAAHGADERVHRVVTVGTPHHGTWLARFSFSTNGLQMRRRSAWRQALEARERKENPGRFERFTCFHSHCDNIAFPASTATLVGADNRHLAGMAHVQMADQAVVLNEVLAWLKPSSAGVAARSEVSVRASA